MSELLSCPFCGGEAELKHNKSWDYFVRCKSCGVRTRQHHENHIGAEIDWNSRAERTCHMELTDNKALRQLVRDLYGYLESDYTPSYYEPFKERMRALGIEVDR